MQLIRKFFYTIIVVVLLAILAVWIFLTSHKPQYNGTVQVKGLHEQVEVLYDFFGIPHIYAKNEEDAYFALGFVQAQDRLFQMEMTRRVASGQLAEVLGKDFVKVDAFFRTLGLHQHAKEASGLFMQGDTAAYQRAAKAFLAGMNNFIETGRTPIEFLMMGIEKKPYVMEDLYLVTEYMAFNFAMGFRTDPLMTYIDKKIGHAYYCDLQAHYVSDSKRNPVFPFIPSKDTVSIAFNSVSSYVNSLPIPPFVGSNGWVMSAAKSRSGKVLFANDTHIAYGQPSVWYEAHMEYPGSSFYGNYLAGVPFAALGHSREYSWGLTMFENDDLDFYMERVNPNDTNKVRCGNTFLPLQSRVEKIKVKDESDYLLTVRNSRNGPLVQDVMPEWKNVTSEPVAASWTHLKFPNNLMQVTYSLGHATNFGAFQSAVAGLVSPGLNVMYGDKAGNIAWWAAGKLPVRPSGIDPVLLQEGSLVPQEGLSYLPFTSNPQAVNPPSGFVYSANNQPDSMPGQGLYPGYYVPEDRAVRIEQLLTDKERYSLEDFQRIQTDAVSPIAPEVAHTLMEMVRKDYLAKNPIAHQAGSRLLTWGGDHQLHDIGPVIYYKFVYHVFALAMEDELGKENFTALLSTHVLKSSIPAFCANDRSGWWDDIRTGDIKETRAQIVNKAFERTIQELTAQLGENVDRWEWGRVHLLEHVHPIGMKKPFNLFFNVGPFPATGGMEVINQIAFDLNGEGIYRAKFGPAMRTVIDFANVENAVAVLPTGESGNVMSPFYMDQAVLYNAGKYRKQRMNRVDIEESNIGRLLLEPNKH